MLGAHAFVIAEKLLFCFSAQRSFNDYLTYDLTLFVLKVIHQRTVKIFTYLQASQSFFSTALNRIW